jgi:nucleotide-binding universal stress UspA family protein
MYEHLLVPVDDSELSERAMSGSIELARRLSARITGFIAEPFANLAGDGYSFSAAAAALDDRQLAEHAQQVLTRFEHMAREAGVPFQGHCVQTADIDEAIVGAARRHGCDMIVMATHGRGPLGEFLWGSHTKNVITHCDLPLLVLH